MRAGMLKDLFQFQAPSGAPTVDAYGAPVRTWQTYSELFGKMRILSGGDILVGGQEQAVKVYQGICRMDPRIQANHRVIWHGRNGSKTLEISKPGDPDESGNMMIFEATYKPEPTTL